MSIFGTDAWIKGLSRLGCGMALLLALAGCVGVSQQVPPYRVSDLAAGDEVTVTAGDRGVTVDIRSQTGIGSATLIQLLDPAPAALTLRLHLKGLETLRFTYAEAEITVRVSSTSPGLVGQEVRLAGAEPQAIGPDSPYWLAVRLPEGQSIPLASGAIEVTAPPAFLASGARTFALQWIDFYR